MRNHTHVFFCMVQWFILKQFRKKPQLFEDIRINPDCSAVLPFIRCLLLPARTLRTRNSLPNKDKANGIILEKCRRTNSQFLWHEMILKMHSNIPQLEAVRQKPHHKACWCVIWLQCHLQIMFQTGLKTTTWKPFHMQGGKWTEECLMAFYTIVRYRLEWESRSWASQGAALQRRMATKL